MYLILKEGDFYSKPLEQEYAFSIGWILGGKLGVGTIVTALGLGISLAYIFKFYDIDLKELKHRNIKEEVVHLKKVFF